MAADEHPAVVRARSVVQGLLRSGLAVALVLMAAGLSMKLAAGDSSAPHVPLHSLFHAPSGGDALMAWGILALAVTPAARVIALLVLWSVEHDRRFVLVALAVLVVLAVAALAGGG